MLSEAFIPTSFGDSVITELLPIFTEKSVQVNSISSLKARAAIYEDAQRDLHPHGNVERWRTHLKEHNRSSFFLLLCLQNCGGNERACCGKHLRHLHDDSSPIHKSQGRAGGRILSVPRNDEVCNLGLLVQSYESGISGLLRIAGH